MNRKQKIIVSVTSIFLVLLLLVGLTYAYFLTQINGNENSKSISVTTANLALVYGDGNGIITTDELIIPGTTLDSKTFTVKNEGNAVTDYVVVIEDVKVTYAATVGDNVAGSSTTFESNDFVYTLTCTSDGEACSGVDTETIFPINGGILVGNKIEVGKTHTYSLTVTYKETGVDQSNDMNKTLEAKVNIRDIAEINPYSSNKNTLAYNIINNAMSITETQKQEGYAELVSVPKTKVAAEINLENESVLSITPDDYGISYYYRGSVQNNYVDFNGMCWRIVRIEGDGSIKLVLEDKDNTCATSNGNWDIGTGDYGYNLSYKENSSSYKADYENTQNRTTSMKYKFDEWFNANLTSVSNKLKTTTVCIGETTNKYDDNGNLMTDAQATEQGYWNYNNYKRLYNDRSASLVCNAQGGRTSESKIYPLTADEVVFAGGSVATQNNTFYLLNDYQKSNSLLWWTLSPAVFDDDDYVFYIAYTGYVYDAYTVRHRDASLRPSVSLLSNTIITGGNGIKYNPYVIE